MRLAKKLADRIVFLHEGRAVFEGTSVEMAQSQEPIVRQFLELDELNTDQFRHGNVSETGQQPSV
jgi:phospholipid/cholesterol/gamma-HCH transport system ATP-binding protein